jgi:hypothetical protein
MSLERCYELWDPTSISSIIGFFVMNGKRTSLILIIIVVISYERWPWIVECLLDIIILRITIDQTTMSLHGEKLLSLLRNL